MMRRSLSPSPRTFGEVHGQRRYSGGARHEISERVVLRAPAFEAEGWTLNVSRGGVRLIVEEPLELGAVYELVIGASDSARFRLVQVVWVQDEADGQICGAQFLDSEGSVPPPLAEER